MCLGVPGTVVAIDGLTAPVRSALPAVVEGVRAELGALGIAPIPRAAPHRPDVWWERPAP